MKDLLETLIALGMILVFLCVPVAVLGTLGYCLYDLLKRKP